MAVDSFIKINFCNKIVSYFSREIVRYKEVLRLIEINAWKIIIEDTFLYIFFHVFDNIFLILQSIYNSNINISMIRKVKISTHKVLFEAAFILSTLLYSWIDILLFLFNLLNTFFAFFLHLFRTEGEEVLRRDIFLQIFCVFCLAFEFRCLVSFCKFIVINAYIT